MPIEARRARPRLAVSAARWVTALTLALVVMGGGSGRRSGAGRLVHGGR